MRFHFNTHKSISKGVFIPLFIAGLTLASPFAWSYQFSRGSQPQDNSPKENPTQQGMTPGTETNPKPFKFDNQKSTETNKDQKHPTTKNKHPKKSKDGMMDGMEKGRDGMDRDNSTHETKPKKGTEGTGAGTGTGGTGGDDRGTDKGSQDQRNRNEGGMGR